MVLLNFLCEQFLNEPENVKAEVFMALSVAYIYWICETDKKVLFSRMGKRLLKEMTEAFL